MLRAGLFKLPVILGVALVTASLPEPSAAFVPSGAEDGWYTWRVPATENAPDWCCYSWNRGEARKGECDLDSKKFSYGSHDDDPFNPEQMQLYAFIENGAASVIRALSPRCKVTTMTEIQDLGVIASNESIGWLQEYVSPRSEISSHVLAAISVHGGPDAFETLTAVARDRSSLENRKDAVFWMVQSQSDQAMDYVDRLLTDTQ